MKKQTKVITALVIISTMILSIVMSKSLAARPDNTNNYTFQLQEQVYIQLRSKARMDKVKMLTSTMYMQQVM